MLVKLVAIAERLPHVPKGNDGGPPPALWMSCIWLLVEEHWKAVPLQAVITVPADELSVQV